MTHKKVSIPDIKGYCPLLVGASTKKELKKVYKYSDDVGENISEKNPHYCELTGMFWIWKNVKEDYIGVCHYRRFFTKSNLYSHKEKYYLREQDVLELLKKYEVIVPEARKEKDIIPNIVRIAPNKKDLIEIKEAIEKVSPSYLEDYEKFLSQNCFYMYNMIVTKKKIFDAYCEWLFPILNYIEEHHDISKEDAYRQRLYGFLSERLLMVWLYHNIPIEKVKEMNIINTDETSLKLVLHKVKNYYRQLQYKLLRK